MCLVVVVFLRFAGFMTVLDEVFFLFSAPITFSLLKKFPLIFSFFFFRFPTFICFKWKRVSHSLQTEA